MTVLTGTRWLRERQQTARRTAMGTAAVGAFRRDRFEALVAQRDIGPDGARREQVAVFHAVAHFDRQRWRTPRPDGRSPHEEFRTILDLLPVVAGRKPIGG